MKKEGRRKENEEGKKWGEIEHGKDDKKNKNKK